MAHCWVEVLLYQELAVTPHSQLRDGSRPRGGLLPLVVGEGYI